jgi:hypothetical protein
MVVRAGVGDEGIVMAGGDDDFDELASYFALKKSGALGGCDR